MRHGGSRQQRHAAPHKSALLMSKVCGPAPRGRLYREVWGGHTICIRCFNLIFYLFNRLQLVRFSGVCICKEEPLAQQCPFTGRWCMWVYFMGAERAKPTLYRDMLINSSSSPECYRLYLYQTALGVYLGRIRGTILFTTPKTSLFTYIPQIKWFDLRYVFNLVSAFYTPSGFLVF